jgi:hypothetical protein
MSLTELHFPKGPDWLWRARGFYGGLTRHGRAMIFRPRLQLYLTANTPATAANQTQDRGLWLFMSRHSLRSASLSEYADCRWLSARTVPAADGPILGGEEKLEKAVRGPSEQISRIYIPPDSHNGRRSYPTFRNRISQRLAPLCMQTVWSATIFSPKCSPRPVPIPIARPHICRGDV